MTGVARFLVVGLVAAFAVACGDDDSDDPAASVSLASDVVPIMAARCGTCHQPGGNPGAIANGTYFNTADDIMGKVDNAFGTIVSGDSANSGLIKIMKQEISVGAGPTLMPPPPSGNDPVPAGEIDTVAKWIDDGAVEN